MHRFLVLPLLLFALTPPEAGAQTFTLSNNVTLSLDNSAVLDLDPGTTLVETGGGRLTGGTGVATATRTLNAPTGVDGGGLGFTITSGENLGSVTLTRGHIAQTGAGNTGIARFYDVTAANNTDLGATLIFAYDEAELGGLDETTLELFRSEDGGATWQGQGGTVDAGANTITLSGIDAFSRWTAGEGLDAIVNVDGAIDVLTLTVEALDLKKGLENALITKLENALASFEAGNTGAAVNKLGAFINQVNAKRGKDISDAEADALIGFAQAIIDAINDGTAAKRGAGAAEVAAEVPTAYVLESNYPNPFNPSTEIRFDLPEAGHVRLVVYDVMGREVARLLDQPMGAGTHAVTWDASGLPSGTYLYRLTAGAFTETKAMALLK